MTWRTTLYLLTVLMAAVVVATTAISESPANVEPAAGATAVAQIEPLSMPLPEHSSRVVLLLVGIGAVAVTYRHAWTSFRRRS